MPTLPIAETRFFTGFELERSTYTRVKLEWLARFPGLFIAIVRDEVEGPFSSFEEAERAGYHRFGLGPLYIKRLLADEPVSEISRDVRA